MVYEVVSPRLVARHKAETYYGDSLADLRSQIRAASKVRVDKETLKPFIVTYLKGHGEANVEAIRDYATNVNKRKLRQLTTNDDVEEDLRRLMGAESDMRKELLGLV